MKHRLTQWLDAAMHRPGGDILVVQTLRNAIMAASVLASAAMVALMGVLATAHMHPKLWAALAALGLAASASMAIAAIVKLVAVGFEAQAPQASNNTIAHELSGALAWGKRSALLLSLALIASAVAVLA